MRRGIAPRNVAHMFRAAHGPGSVFKLKTSGASSAIAGSGRQLEAWRAAATRVWMCWDALLASEPEGRRRAFVAYTAALDQEAAAAAQMAADRAMRSSAGA
jgi:hypothetical protein